MIEKLSFLEEGEFTKRNQTTREIAFSLDLKRYSKVGAISRYVSQMRFDDSKKYSEWRKRTASEILNSGYVNGCTDIALAYIALARELKIPTRYVETLQEDWLINPDFKRIEGHIFLDVFLDGRWRAFEPKEGFIQQDKYVLEEKKYAVVGKGLDFSQIYILDKGVYRKNPVRLEKIGDEVIECLSAERNKEKRF